MIKTYLKIPSEEGKPAVCGPAENKNPAEVESGRQPAKILWKEKTGRNACHNYPLLKIGARLQNAAQSPGRKRVRRAAFAESKKKGGILRIFAFGRAGCINLCRPFILENRRENAGRRAAIKSPYFFTKITRYPVDKGGAKCYSLNKVSTHL